MARATRVRRELAAAAGTDQLGMTVTIDVVRAPEPDIDPPLGEMTDAPVPMDGADLLRELVGGLALAADRGRSTEEGAA
ncbi:MAG: hypothetical protein E6G27_17595, partial [Actinobacteria bacterium]